MRSALTSGSLLAGRYRLQDRVVDNVDDAQWMALDEVLRRPVTVRFLPADGPLTDAVISAARASAGVSDSRFLRVLDANIVDELVVVVSEWVTATDLVRLLDDGPLDPEEARRIAHEVASALAAAHRQGLRHLRLTPEKVLRCDTGQVKIVGLGIDAAASGGEKQGTDPVLTDTEGAGAVLYAALTGRWPLPPSAGRTTAVPEAPAEGGAARRPRQVRAGVPADLDEIAVRALAAPRSPARALTSPQDVARALDPGLGDSDTSPLLLPVLDPLSGPAPQAQLSRRTRRVAATVLGSALAALVGLVGWQLGVGSTAGPDLFLPGAQSVATRPATAPPLSDETIPVVAIQDFDPHGDGTEDHGEVRLAVDGRSETVWHTQTYFGDARLGRLKPGVGLVLDLGQRRRIRSVSFLLDGRGTDLAIGTADRPSTSERGYPIVASVTGAGPSVTLRPESPVLARYLLVWLTSLPELATDSYRGGIAEVVVNR